MSNSKETYHKHSHRDSSLETLIDFVSDEASIGRGIDVLELIQCEDQFGERNIDKILQLYTEVDFSQYINKVGTLSAQKILQVTTTKGRLRYSILDSGLIEANRAEINLLPLIIGTELILPLVKVDRELRKLDTNQVVDFRNFRQFLTSQLYDLLKDPKYERTYKIKAANPINTIRDIFPFISIWVWSRSLSVDEKGGYLDQIINITPFVTTLNTTVGSNGGNFNITLAPVSAEYIREEGWVIDRQLKVAGNQFISNNSFYKSQQKDQPLLRNDYYFHNIIQENDVIFIRFEKLDLEENREKLEKTFDISKDQISGNIYDMIGLVDTNTISTQGASGDVNINVGGRDLVKLFIEDGLYFYPFDYTGSGIFANEEIGDRLERYDGQLKSRFQLGFKNIDNTLKFIFNALSSIKITSDSLFDSYESSSDIKGGVKKDRRSKKFFVDRKQLEQSQKEVESQEEEKNQILQLLERSIGAEGINSKPNVNAVYNKMIDFLKAGKKKGVVQETNNKLQGWSGGWVFDSETIKKNNLPSIFGNRLYLDSRVWRDGNGNIITDSERLEYLAKVERQLRNIKLQQNDVIMGRNLDEDNKQKIKDAQRQAAIDKSLQEFLNQVVKENNEIVGQRDAIPDPALAATSGRLTQRQIEQKLKYDLLQGEYEALEKKGKTIKAVVVPKQFTELNIYAKEAFERTWVLIKRIENYNNEPIVDELKPTKGIWQIIKLVIDDNIRTRRIVDSSIGNEHGSLINALRKIAQEPFVELLFDTYGDQYYITVRKPPFDKKGMIDMINDQDLLVDKPILPTVDFTRDFDDQIGKGPLEADGDKKQSIVIDIEDYDVISDSLNYGVTNQIFSWYRLTPQNLISGQANDTAFVYLKAIYLKEYADIWGSKPLDLTTNYIPYFPIVDKNSKLPTAYFIKQGILDLKYMIESNAYNPFVRQGTITVIGNRLFKRGTFVRLKSTSEIFYIEGVVQNYSITDRSISRVTTLQVSRGMVEAYIKGVEINGTKYSYFDIVDTEIDDAKFMQQDQGFDSANKILVNWKVRPEVFYFFLKQKQFANIANFINIPPADIDGLTP